MSSCSSESGEGSRRLRPRIWFWDGRASSDCSREVLAAELAVSCAVGCCCDRWLLGSGAEIAVLEGKEGVVGVDGSSEVDGDDIEGWERSSARTTSAGVPPGESSLGWRLCRRESRYPACGGCDAVSRCLGFTRFKLERGR
jgi:hypothetical protein